MSESERRIGVAFVGAGVHLTRAHAKHLKLDPQVRLIGVFDPADASVQQLHAEVGADHELMRYSTYEALLADSMVEAVVIGSPDRFHLPQLVAAVDAGKHVFCEKPLCDSTGGLTTLTVVLQKAAAAGLVVTSCHPRRFDPPYVWVKESLPALVARLGPPVELKLDFQYHKPDQNRTGLHGGSLLQDHMNHEFDYLNFVFGPCACTAYKLFDAEDRYHVAGQREDGLVFSFSGTRRLDSPTYAETIDIRFARGVVHIDTYDAGKSYLQDHEQPYAPCEPLPVLKTDYDCRFAAINANWINAILGRGANYLTAEGLTANSLMSVGFAQQDSVSYRPQVVV